MHRCAAPPSQCRERHNCYVVVVEEDGGLGIVEVYYAARVVVAVVKRRSYAQVDGEWDLRRHDLKVILLQDLQAVFHLSRQGGQGRHSEHE